MRVFRISSTMSRRRSTSNSQQESKPRKVFDARYRIDGYDFRYRFEQKGWAEAFLRELQDNFAQGWLFDPNARRFVDPDADGAVQTPLTVFEHFRDYLQRKWRGWAPSSRAIAQADLARGCLHLVKTDAPALSPAERRRALAYLRTAAFVPESPEPGGGEWEKWFLRWSLPLADVTDEHLQTYIDDVRDRGHDRRPRRLAPSSLARTRAVVHGAFTYAVKRRLIEWNPWGPVHVGTSPDRHHVDPDLVMDPGQVVVMAEACGRIDRRYLAYVLVQGFCGLRPGEAAELRRRDVLRSGGQPATLRVSGTRSDTPERFFLEHEDRRRPLRAMATASAAECLSVTRSRRRWTPICSSSSGRNRRRGCSPRPRAGRSTRRTSNAACGSPPATRSSPPGHPLRNVRRHDLRHSAITGWLGAGVPLKTAQQWSGHRTLSVLLDTYAGVLDSDEALAVTRLGDFYERFTDESQ